MNRMKRLAIAVTLGATLSAADAFACGDKVLVGSRGTRYQRPKNARVASVVIYGNPQESARLEEMLKRQGHRTIIASTVEQLTSLASANRFDAVVAAGDVVTKIEQLLNGSSIAAGVVVLNSSARPSTILRSIDKAVDRHDSNARPRSR